MKKFKNKKENINVPNETDELNNEEEKVDRNAIPTVVDRVEHGLVGTLRITDNMNSPLFRPNDMVHIRQSQRPQKKDIILYKSHDEYFLRRIIKIKEDTAYVAGDSERSYHLVKRDEIVGKAIGRERKNKYLSLGLNPKKKLYTFNKVNLAMFRLGNRVTNYEQDVNNESLELAQLALENQQNSMQNTQRIQTNVEIDADLSSFLDPDELVKELKAAGGIENIYESQAEQEPEIEDETEESEDIEDTQEEVEASEASEIVEE